MYLTRHSNHFQEACDAYLICSGRSPHAPGTTTLMPKSMVVVLILAVRKPVKKNNFDSQGGVCVYCADDFHRTISDYTTPELQDCFMWSRESHKRDSTAFLSLFFYHSSFFYNLPFECVVQATERASSVHAIAFL